MRNKVLYRYLKYKRLFGSNLITNRILYERSENKFRTDDYPIGTHMLPIITDFAPLCRLDCLFTADLLAAGTATR